MRAAWEQHLCVTSGNAACIVLYTQLSTEEELPGAELGGNSTTGDTLRKLRATQPLLFEPEQSTGLWCLHSLVQLMLYARYMSNRSSANVRVKS